MKSFTFLLFVALAAVALATPAVEEEQHVRVQIEPEEEVLLTLDDLKELGLSDEEIENYFNLFGGLVKKFKGKIQSLYKQVCKKNKTDVCKRWAKQHITEENVEKAWKELKPLVKKFCAKKSNKLCLAVKLIL